MAEQFKLDDVWRDTATKAPLVSQHAMAYTQSLVHALSCERWRARLI
jgi:hypothetical protein